MNRSLTADFTTIAGLPRHAADRKIVYIEPGQIVDAVRWVKNDLVRAAISPCPDPEAFAEAAAGLRYDELLKEQDENWGSPRLLREGLDLIRDWIPEDYGDGTMFLHGPGERSQTTSMHVDASIAIHFTAVGGIDYLAGDLPADIKLKMINSSSMPSGFFERELELHDIWARRTFATNPGDTIIFSDLPHRTSKRKLESGFACNLVFLRI